MQPPTKPFIYPSLVGKHFWPFFPMKNADRKKNNFFRVLSEKFAVVIVYPGRRRTE